jgi:hypothetical protein
MSNSNIQSSDVSATVREAFNFTVDKFPLSGPDNMKTDQYGLFRSDTGYINNLKSISGRYVPHSTDDVCALVDAASTLFDGEVECKTHWNKGHYVSVAPTGDRRKAIFGTSDNIFPRIVIRGGFDGKGFHGTMGYWRDACSNLAMLRQVAGTSVSIRHTSGLRDRMNELVNTFEQLEDGWNNLAAMAERMESKDVNFEEFVKEVYAKRVPSDEQREIAKTEKVRAVTLYDNMLDKMKSRIRRERQVTGRSNASSNIVTAWEAYNAVQGYNQHDAFTRGGSDFAGILRAANDSHVRTAEAIASDPSQYLTLAV